MRVKRRFNTAGFTIIEVMILLAILGILAAIAVPNFIEMQYRSKRAEVPANLDDIKIALLAYESAFGHLSSEENPQPDDSPGKNFRGWRAGSGFDALGWQPDGDVRGAYTITTATPGDFTIRGVCDVDGDGVRAVYTASRSVNALQMTPVTTY
jgi:type IV pilus assembly protein PilA